jgi:membrane-bound lytic murein transglycosylase D
MFMSGSRPSENKKLIIMALINKKHWIACLFASISLVTGTAFAQGPRETDSLPIARELVIATANAHQPDSSARIRMSENRPVNATKNTSPAPTAANNTGLDDLHPMAIAFVRDYLDVHQQRLEKMKSWGGPYFLVIDQILAKYQLPTELKYLAVIESNLKSTALSNKGAVGPWQFMPETGRIYGLKISGSRDDRRDLYKSTHAAARYLRDLYKQLGDWLLVIAAYNGGDARVESAIRKSKSRDFWKLQYNLPAESRNHVKKFIATHYIMEGHGGVTTSTAADIAKSNLADPDPALVEGTTTQTVSGKYLSLVVAKNLGMDIRHFNALNPGFDQKVGVGDYPLRLPIDKMDIFNAQRVQMLGESVQFMLTNAEGTKEEYPAIIKIPAGKKSNRPGK